MSELDKNNDKNNSTNNIETSGQIDNSSSEKDKSDQNHNIPKKKKMRISQYKANMYICGLKIKKVYFSNEEKEFIIIKAEDDNDIHVFGGEVNQIAHLLAECKYLTDCLILNKATREMFDYQRATAINSYLIGEIDVSKEILKSLLSKLHERKVVTKKLWYIGIFLIVTLCMICISMFNRDYIYIKIATFGAIGGFISLNMKLENIKFEISESTISYIIVSMYKVIFSMLTSIICYFLIQSELILGIIKNNNSNNLYFIYSISTLAGFSESLLPNIFKSIENKTKVDKIEQVDKRKT